MAKIRVKGDTSGYIDITAPATADNSTLDLSTVAKTNSANTFTGSVTTNNNLEVSAPSAGGSYRALNFTVGSNAGRIVFTGDSFGDANYGQGDLTIQTQSAGGQIRFGTGAAGVNQMKIDDSGRVTMPNQPAFGARGANGGANATNVATYTLGTGGAYNVGSHYNFSNSRFTAPVAGRYLFTWNWYTNNGALGETRITINGNYADGTYGPLSRSNFGGTNYTNIHASAVLSLAATDYAEIYITGGSAYFDNDCWFTGILIG